MTIPSSMGANKLDIRYGDRNTIPYYNGILAPTIATAANTLLAGGSVSSPYTAANIAQLGAVAGAAYSITTGGYLVPGILATASSTGGVLPYFGVSGLDANNYPDVWRTRGMPGMLSAPSPAPGGVASQLPTAYLTVTGASTAAITVTYGGQNLIVNPTFVLGTITQGTGASLGTITGSGTFTPVVTNGVLISVTVSGLSGMTVGNIAQLTVAFGTGQPANTPFPFHGIPSTTTLSGAFATIQHNAAVELATTCYDNTLSYTPGAPLTCIAAGNTNAGRIRTLADAANNIIIGYVAPAAEYISSTGYGILAFTPRFQLQGTPSVPTT